MKSLYDKRSLQTATSQAFGIEISDAIKPILDKYVEQGYCVRHLSHEAQAVVRDIELDYMVDIHVKDAKAALLRRKKREQKEGKTKTGGN